MKIETKMKMKMKRKKRLANQIFVYLACQLV